MHTSKQQDSAPVTPVDRRWIDQLQQNFITYFRLFAGLPGITFTEGAVTWNASHGAPGSMVLGTQLTGDDIDQQIDETLRQIGQQTDAVDWFTFPSCQPSDLGDRLRARGKVGGPDGEWLLYGNIGGPGGNWMWTDLTKLSPLHAIPSLAMPAAFHIKQVANQAMFDEWTAINAKGFGAAEYSAFHAAYSRHGFGPDAQAIHFIGYLGDEPVTSATLLDLMRPEIGGSVSVYNVSTPTAMRHRGFGSAITHAALQEAQRRGYRDTWIWASSLGKSVYSKLGFVLTDFGIHEYQWKKKSVS